MGAEIAVASLLLTAYSTYEGVQERKTAQAERGKAQVAQGRIAAIESRRARAQAVREARIKRAALVAESEAIGGAGSSGELGGLGSLQSQLGGNIGDVNVQTGLSEYASNRLGAAAAAETQASIFQSFAGIGSSVFQASGGFETIFKTEEYGTKGT